MGFLEGVLTKIGMHLADKIFELVKDRLQLYFDTKIKLTKIGTEADQLKNELMEAQSDQERMAILRKISSFTDSINAFSNEL